MGKWEKVMKIFNKFSLFIFASIMLATGTNNYSKNKRTQKIQSNIKQEILAPKITPQNSVLVFDIHNVIVKLSIKKALKSFGRIKDKIKIIGKLLKFAFNGKQAIEPAVLDLKNEQDLNNKLGLINPHTPIEQTIKILNKLKSLGFQIYGCSNICEKSFVFMKNRYPKVFNLMTACYTRSAANMYTKKNQAQAYEELIKLINLHSPFTPKHIIFIDDTLTNLNLASTVDSRFITIHFKNPAQLIKSLQNIGFTI